MGVRGPIPKRAVQRRRRNVTETETVVVTESAKLFGPPLGNPSAHPLAANWYGGLRKSGQAEFYQASDWATAQVWAELLSVALGQERPSAVMIAAWSSEAANLLTTEGSRRRLRMELERSKGPDADQQRAKGTILDLRARLAGG